MRVGSEERLEGEDSSQPRSEEGRTADVMCNIMNSIFPAFLKFEMEHPEQFPDARLPTLDFQCWMEKNRIQYLFYQKGMAKKTLINKHSALSENVKVASLSQDLVRRMMNTSELLSTEERVKVVNEYSDNVRASGYSAKQTKKLVEAGLTGYERKLRKAESEGRFIHRSASDGVESRQRKKLLGREEWFLDKKKEETMTNRRKKRSYNPKTKSPNTESVLFVCQTRHGQLAKRLQQVEDNIAQVTGNRVKVVERSGTTIRQLLVKSNPWAGGHCGRDCMVCEFGDGKQNCFEKNIVYEITCLECEKQNKTTLYVGETSRSMHCRFSREHWRDYQNGVASSPLTKHSALSHLGSKSVQFRMKVYKKYFTALQRMIGEAVHISRKSSCEGIELLNSKSEYSRTKLPRLIVDQGGGGGEEKCPPQSQASEISVVCDKVDGAVRNRIQKSEFPSVHLDSSRQTGSQSNNKYFSIFNSCRPDITKVKKRSREE